MATSSTENGNESKDDIRTILQITI